MSSQKRFLGDIVEKLPTVGDIIEEIPTVGDMNETFKLFKNLLANVDYKIAKIKTLFIISITTIIILLLVIIFLLFFLKCK